MQAPPPPTLFRGRNPLTLSPVELVQYQTQGYLSSDAENEENARRRQESIARGQQKIADDAEEYYKDQQRGAQAGEAVGSIWGPVGTVVGHFAGRGLASVFGGGKKPPPVVGSTMRRQTSWDPLTGRGAGRGNGSGEYHTLTYTHPSAAVGTRAYGGTYLGDGMRVETEYMPDGIRGEGRGNNSPTPFTRRRIVNSEGYTEYGIGGKRKPASGSERKNQR